MNHLQLIKKSNKLLKFKSLISFMLAIGTLTLPSFGGYEAYQHVSGDMQLFSLFALLGIQALVIRNVINETPSIGQILNTGFDYLLNFDTIRKIKRQQKELLLKIRNKDIDAQVLEHYAQYKIYKNLFSHWSESVDFPDNFSHIIKLVEDLVDEKILNDYLHYYLSQASKDFCLNLNDKNQVEFILSVYPEYQLKESDYQSLTQKMKNGDQDLSEFLDCLMQHKNCIDQRRVFKLLNENYKNQDDFFKTYSEKFSDGVCLRVEMPHIVEIMSHGSEPLKEALQAVTPTNMISHTELIHKTKQNFDYLSERNQTVGAAAFEQFKSKYTHTMEVSEATLAELPQMNAQHRMRAQILLQENLVNIYQTSVELRGEVERRLIKNLEINQKVLKSYK